MLNGDESHVANPWWQFYGRTDELSQLTKAWERAQKRCPQWVAFVGDSGLGKTRLIHEFYREVSNGQQDGTPYWPAELPLDETRLELNPRLSSFNSMPDGPAPKIGELASAKMRNLENPPWLWWAMRGMPKQSGRNPTAGASAAYDAAHFLKPHVARLGLKSAGVDLMLDVGKKMVSSVVEKTPLGFISDFINLLEVGEKAIGLLSSSSKNLSGVSQRAEGDVLALRTLIIENIFVFLEQGIPIILVLDDIHHFDPDSTALIHDLILKVGNRLFPLMIVSTCWPDAWNAGHPVRSEFRNFKAEFGDSGQEVALQKMSKQDSRQFLRGFLPGLKAEDIELIIGKADGNFLFLSQICEELSIERHFFENWDLECGLIDDGRHFLRTMTTDMEKFIASRFKRLPFAVQAALEISSYQGSRFAPEMTAAVSDRPDVKRHAPPDSMLDSVSIRDALQHAEQTAAVLRSPSNHVKEFIYDPYWNVALTSLQARRAYSHDVESAYLGIARELLERCGENGAAVAVDEASITLLERLGDTSADPQEQLDVFALLLDVAAVRRLYDAALAYVCRLGLILSGDEQVGTSPHGILNFEWDERLPLSTTVLALQVLSRFGFQPPAGSGLTGALVERCAQVLIPRLQLPVFEYLETGVLTDVPLERLLQIARTLVQCRETFGHDFDRKRWTDIVVRLEDALFGAQAADVADDARLIQRIAHHLSRTEGYAVLPVADADAALERRRQEYAEALELVRQVRSPVPRDILEAWCHISRVTFAEEPLGTADGFSECARLTEHARTLMAKLCAAIAAPGSAIREQLGEYNCNHPTILKALLFAGTLLAENARGRGPLDPAYVADFRAIAMDVAAQLESENRHADLGVLKASVIEALLAVELYAAHPGPVPKRLSRTDITELVARSTYLRNTAMRLRNAEGAGTELISACARAKVHDLDVRRVFCVDSNPISDEEIDVHFQQILEDVRLSRDGDRLTFGEAPILLKQSVRFLDVWYGGAQEPTEALFKAYAPIERHRFHKALAQCRAMIAG